jgi:hypothetical protein
MSGIDSRSQKQRAAERKRLDVEDAKACAKRAGNRCEACRVWAPYQPGSVFSGAIHHQHRKPTEAVRRARRYHVWICSVCHREVHSSHGQELNAKLEAICAGRK